MSKRYTVAKRDKWDRFWSILDGETLVCRCLYKCGAQEVVRRLEQSEAEALVTLAASEPKVVGQLEAWTSVSTYTM
jgi:hypothetical protein